MTVILDIRKFVTNHRKALSREDNIHSAQFQQAVTLLLRVRDLAFVINHLSSARYQRQEMGELSTKAVHFGRNNLEEEVRLSLLRETSSVPCVSEGC